MQNLSRIISEHPFFRGLESYYLELIVSCASNVRFGANDYIFLEGHEANDFYLIREGSVALEIFAPNRKPIIIQTFNEGDVLGWSWLVPPYKWRFHARAITPVRAIALDGKCLRSKCETNHNLGYELLKRVVTVIGERLEATRFQILDVYSTEPTAARLETINPRLETANRGER